ncbi:unnamed protein product [Rotaria sp. Silwood2]|nr:unnamed protein product [Rotaria sp. Silwood2]CAF2788170.1 unnamed protein product [Rotaria sp. Silwood2]CAF3966268.1 unnamed protein product [Rotaria sp. Silwood2]CAF4220987.1 unnamed protein product [Rotaria sp. Silwood2]CAF4229262.1 unnamed protein product [Rotaria sp. Silwood2]
MEPTCGQSVFPCIDEPARKAIFHISVIHDPSYAVWSNGELDRSEILMDGRILSHFTPTMKHVLLIYIENALRFDEKTGSALQQQTVTAIAIHETVHQWFGNLVLPSWWSELWLKKDFASYMQSVGSNFIEP